jgi:hypothetical protein
MSGGDRQIKPHLVLEVLNELPDVGGCDLHLAIYWVAPLARWDDVNPIRYCRGRRRFREELHERDSLFAIAFLAHVITILPESTRSRKCLAELGIRSQAFALRSRAHTSIDTLRSLTC